MSRRRAFAEAAPGHRRDAAEVGLKRDPGDWPNRDFSRSVHAAGLDWHVQVAGRGPVLLMLHGAGAATHSWRDLLPLLARDFTVIAPDLPGHGFTDTAGSSQATLAGMAGALAKLLRALDVRPDYAVGHSAGAAILVRMCLEGSIAPRAIMAINGAFRPFGGPVSQLFSPLAKVLSLNPFVPRIFAWSASSPASVERLIRDTGSHIDRRGLELYGRLFAEPRHVAGALRMMANWDLSKMADDIRRLKIPLTLVVGANDKAVPPEQAGEIAALAPGARLIRLRGLGHLAHEEAPEAIAGLVRAMAGASGS